MSQEDMRSYTIAAIVVRDGYEVEVDTAALRDIFTTAGMTVWDAYELEGPPGCRAAFLGAYAPFDLKKTAAMTAKAFEGFGGEVFRAQLVYDEPDEGCDYHREIYCPRRGTGCDFTVHDGQCSDGSTDPRRRPEWLGGEDIYTDTMRRLKTYS